ncbi:hypothetical protein ACMHYB_24015 [Sorangium sp. So ce1128]
MSPHKSRDALIQFLDRRAFEPVLRASSGDYASDADRELLEDVQRRTATEQKRYRESYQTGEEVRTNFLRDLSSEPARKVHAELRRLRLPALPELKDEFLTLCDELGVGPERGAT